MIHSFSNHAAASLARRSFAKEAAKAGRFTRTEGGSK